MPTLGSAELLVVLAVVILLFGSTRIPKLARSVGRAHHEFDRARQGDPEGELP